MSEREWVSYRCERCDQVKRALVGPMAVKPGVCPECAKKAHDPGDLLCDAQGQPVPCEVPAQWQDPPEVSLRIAREKVDQAESQGVLAQATAEAVPYLLMIQPDPGTGNRVPAQRADMRSRLQAALKRWRAARGLE